jgi:cytochrome c-type biogenesis protein CcmH
MVAAALACVATPLLRTSSQGSGKEAPGRSFRTAVIWFLALPLTAGGTYALISNYPWQNPAALTAPAPGGTDATIEQMIAQLEQRLAESPNEVDGWRLLGRSYLMTNQPRRAVQAYEKAYELGGRRDLDTGLDLAEAMLLADDPTLLLRAKEIIDGSLLQSPNNAKALWYSGVIAMNANDVATAKMRWTALLQQNPPPEIRDILTRQLAQLGAPVAATADGDRDAGNRAAAPAGRTIDVAVDLDPALRAKTPAGTTLFVSARAPGIPGPPLAVVRMSAQQWPVTLTLSDANAMIAGRNLSSVDDVEVTARIAFGGTAVTASGDLIGRAVQKRGETGRLGVTIDTVAP